MMKPKLWPIFICYRRADGIDTARRLHKMLDKIDTIGPDGSAIVLDAYLDEDMPGVADWQALHGPFLKRSRALIAVCTPGLKINEGADDWVYKELDWWLGNRTTAPILVDPLNQGVRYVPDQIKNRWPNIQRLVIVEREWNALPAAELRVKADAMRGLILGAIIPSGAEIYAQELAEDQRRAAEASRAHAIAQAFAVDAAASNHFAQSRLIEARMETERTRREGLERDVVAVSGADADGELRSSNLKDEIAQISVVLEQMSADAASERARGTEQLRKADSAWSAIATEQGDAIVATRSRPQPPTIFSIELVNAGTGECILVHYGTPDATSLIMINGGDRAGFGAFVKLRLEELSHARFGGGPVPIELFTAGDQDADKTQGLLQLLRYMAEAQASGGRSIVELKQIWANIFESVGPGLRSEIRRHIDNLGIPLNRPFDHMVMRPERGRVTVTVAGGMEITVLGPSLRSLEILHHEATKKAAGLHLREDPLPREGFSAVPISRIPAPLAASAAAGTKTGSATHAASVAAGRYMDASASNQASTILLLRFAGMTFLHTGDSRGDLILDGLAAAGLLDASGRAFVDLLHVPHHGSPNNITLDFFKQVLADGYLLSGDGRFGNPAVATVASLIAGRGDGPYTMYFVNRDGGESRRERDARFEHGKRLDAFFAAQRTYAPMYRRVFRSNESGSLIVDLLDPVRY